MRHRALTTSAYVLLMSIVGTLYPSIGLAVSVVSENIIYLQEDGRGHLDYSTVRTGWRSYELYLDKDEPLEEYLYVYPTDYEVDEESDEQAKKLLFPQGSYATIRRGRFDKEVTLGEDQTFTFNSWDGSKRPDGHFGAWVNGNDFTEFVYAWVFPETIDILSYESNRQGEWVRRNNTLAFYAEEVNDLTFTLKYRLRARQYAPLLKDQSRLEAHGEVALEQDKNLLRITVLERLLFPSGGSKLTSKGKDIIADLANSLGPKPTATIVVEGHTDDVPIESEFKDIYPTNWELSAARSLAVVRHLAEIGFPEDQLEVRAYGHHRPRASNETPGTRAKNRRIELLIAEPADS